MTTDGITYDDTKLEDLNYFWTKSGVPCFMADRDNIEEIIENLGFSIYYLICNVAEDRKVENKIWQNGKYETQTSYLTDLSTSIVKVVNNIVSRSVSKIEDEEIYDFASVREEAEYLLPLIPYVIIEKLDEFFRLVDAQHGTESIVLLTFDPTKDDSSGWGVLVPEQVNTSVHCKYDPDSVVDLKPDHVMIVGSVHSHPNMAAYASGTDHADQADFDGIHITYGWQKSVNNGATQYHIELQASGKSFTMKPEDVFEHHYVDKQPDPEVVEWSSKVKKVSPPQGGQRSESSAPLPTQLHPTELQVTPAVTQLGYTLPGTTKANPRLQSFPELKEDNPYLVICEIDNSHKETVECPSCGHLMNSDLILHDYACELCDALVVYSNENYENILAIASDYLMSRNLPLSSAIYLWTSDDYSNEMLLRIKEADYLDNDKEYLTLAKDDTYSPYDEEYASGFDENHSVCCNVSLSDRFTCTCSNPVYYEDVIKFDQNHPNDIYDRTSNCLDCQHYYSRFCGPYMQAILDFAIKNKTLAEQIVVCDAFQEYDRSISYGYTY